MLSSARFFRQYIAYSATEDTLVNLMMNDTSSQSRRVLDITHIFRSRVYHVVYRLRLGFAVRILLRLASLVFFNRAVCLPAGACSA